MLLSIAILLYGTQSKGSDELQLPNSPIPNSPMGHRRAFSTSASSSNSSAISSPGHRTRHARDLSGSISRVRGPGTYVIVDQEQWEELHGTKYVPGSSSLTFEVTERDLAKQRRGNLMKKEPVTSNSNCGCGIQ